MNCSTNRMIIGMVTADATVVIRKIPEDRAVLPLACSVYIVTSAPVGVAASAQKDRSMVVSWPIRNISMLPVIIGVAISRRAVIHAARRLNRWLKSLFAMMQPMRTMASGVVMSASQPTGVMINSGIRISAARSMIANIQTNTLSLSVFLMHSFIEKLPVIMAGRMLKNTSELMALKVHP